MADGDDDRERVRLAEAERRERLAQPISIDVEVRRPAGVDGKLVRVAKENASALKLKKED